MADSTPSQLREHAILRLDDVLGDLGRIALAHENLSELLGIRRPTCSMLLSEMRREGVIETGRNSITIADRPKLRSLACDCYEALRLLDLHQ